MNPLVVERHHLFPHLDTVRVVPVGASGEPSRGGRGVAVARGSVSGGRGTVGGVVQSVGAALVLALRGAGLSDGTAAAIRGGLCAGRGVRGVLLDAVVRRRRHTRHVTGRCLKECEKRV